MCAYSSRRARATACVDLLARDAESFHDSLVSTGQKYHADDDRTMVEYRLRNRRLCQRINDAPWPERLPPNHVHADLLGDERRCVKLRWDA